MSLEYRKLSREIAGLKELLELNDLMTETETCKWLGIAKRTLQNRISKGTLSGTYIINRLGHRMFYKSKLIAPAEESTEELLTNKQKAKRQTVEAKDKAA